MIPILLLPPSIRYSVVATDHGGGYGSAANTDLGNADDLDRFGLKTAAVDLNAGEESGQFDAEDLNYARDEVFQSFTLVDDESDDDAIELRATILGTTGYTGGRRRPLAQIPTQLRQSKPLTVCRV